MDSFAAWINNLKEWADFGLSNKKKEPLEATGKFDDPIKRCNIEHVINDLRKQHVGIRESQKNSFFGEAQWGKEPGAIKVNFGPYGGLRATIRRLCVNALGENQWICKKSFEVKNHYDIHADALTLKLWQSLNEIDKQGIDAPKKDYEGLERLVLRLADHLKKNNTQKILIYEGIKRITKNENYIIHFGCTGMGVQRQDQKRLDQFQVEVRYDKETGVIRILGQEIGDQIDKHRWVTDQSEFIEYFMPGQPEEEILDAVLVQVNVY